MIKSFIAIAPLALAGLIGCSHGSSAEMAATTPPPPAPPPAAATASANRSFGAEACAGLAIAFEAGESKLSAAATAELGKLADCIQANDAHEVIITGRPDPKGDAAANDLLSERRAESVLFELRRRGVSDLDIIIKADGDEGSNQQHILWPYERKVEVQVKRAS